VKQAESRVRFPYAALNSEKMTEIKLDRTYQVRQGPLEAALKKHLEAQMVGVAVQHNPNLAIATLQVHDYSIRPPQPLAMIATLVNNGVHTTSGRVKLHATMHNGKDLLEKLLEALQEAHGK